MDRRIYPKVNIFLKILGRDNKGYHQISSRFLLAHGTLYDEMSIRQSTHFSLSGDFGCEIEDNLIYKAAQILSEYLEGSAKSIEAKALRNLKIEVKKHIPKGAGLGGGSANAGVFLRMANEMFELGLSDMLLAKLGARVGSDVAFFASGARSANVSGRGECVEVLELDSELDSEKGANAMGHLKSSFEIFTPQIFCDTSAVYAEYAKGIANKGQSGYSKIPLLWLSQSSSEILTHSSLEELNDLYAPALRLYPKLKEIAQDLGHGWCFSGSGSSFFRLIKSVRG